MFGNIGWGEFLILLVAALVILGPERLPGAVSWVTKSLRQVREYAGGATQQLKDELGTDFDDLRKPLAELNELRGMSPRAAITKHLLDGDGSLFSALDDTKKSLVDDTKKTFDDTRKTLGATPASPLPSVQSAPVSGHLASGEKPPIDIDAT